MPEVETTQPASSSRAAFERDGFYVLDPGIPETTLDRVIADCKPLLGKDARAQDAWKRSDAVRQLATWPAVLEVLRELHGREALPFQTLNFPKGTQQKVHSDTIHFNSDPPGRMCGVWIALEDIDEDNGPLVYYPGTHRWPEITLADLEREGHLKRGMRDSLVTFSHRLGLPNIGPSPHYPKYERYVERVIEERKPTASYGTVKKGQAIVWAANLLHGGAIQKDPSRTRHSQVTHYYFEADTYYTPLLGNGAFRYVRHPRWITAK